MDHSHMDHSGMNHGDMGHGDGGMGAMCNMNMLFTWDTTNLCIIFRWWHIRSNAGLIISLLGVVALTAGYEALRASSRRYESWVAKRQDSVPLGAVTENTPFLWSGQNQVEVTKRAHVIKALLYALQNFYAFMLMLLFMTYNGWVMLAVAVGAFVGYLFFGTNTSSTKDGACH
ncbi:ctr copper transporter family protein [Phlyctema vagabunda]|uniref:Copper transport protein n=1 Tax=Phlyctema vagabunda TaxID=108571 RepID=A0ABR4PJP7_9HELO